MLTLMISLQSLRICFIDIKTHRIRNLDLILLLLPLAFDRNSTSYITDIHYIFLAFAISLLCRIGGGDFKLFSILVITQGALISTPTYYMELLIVTVFLLVFTVLDNRRWGGSVPLAPAILLPFLLSYLEF